VIDRYKDEKGIVVYAMAQTKDEEFAYFFKKENKDTDTNRWLQSITTFAKNKNLYEIDQKEFLDQFHKFDEIGKTTYIHKRDASVRFVG
jgi:hypothetical protein